KMFTIITRVPENDKMIKRCYSAHIDESNIGEIALLSEEETQEERGTSICISIKPNDWRKVGEYIGDVVKYWEVQPNISPEDCLQLEQPKFFHMSENKDWAILEDTPYDADPVVVVDGIPYKLEPAIVDLKGNIKNNGETVVLFFTTGE